MCPFCHRRIWACTCVVDFDLDEDRTETPVTDDEYERKRRSETLASLDDIIRDMIRETSEAVDEVNDCLVAMRVIKKEPNEEK